jgi:hypothetical protein
MLRCPVCNLKLHTKCIHALQGHFDENGIAYAENIVYYVAYLRQCKTQVSKDEPVQYQGFDGLGRKNTVILTLDGLHFLTMERVEKLLLLK